MRAGKEARRVEASVADLKSWCCGCLHDHPDCFAPLTARGMPVEMMISLSNNLASLGWCARACSVSDSFRDLVIELVLAGRRAEPPRSAAGLRPAPRHTGAGVAMGRR
jgi:hypothetical protein